MIVRALAASDHCRDGNCPTAWLTDRGTVVVQGYVGSRASSAAARPPEAGERATNSAATRRDTNYRPVSGDQRLTAWVEVPEGIVLRTAARLPALAGRPGQAFGRIRPTVAGRLVVRGLVTRDAVELPVPAGEGAVEVSAREITEAASMITAMKEAV